MESTVTRELQEEYGRLRNREIELDIIIASLEDILSQDKTYAHLMELKEEKKHLYDEYKETALNSLLVSGEKSSSGKYGKITVCQREQYKISDEALVPKEFFKPAVDMDKVKEQYLLGKTVPGIEYKNVNYLKITPSREGESS